MSLFARIRDWYRRSTAPLTVPPGQSFPVVGLLKASEFRYGVEIVDDSQTPMSFVLQSLQEDAGLTHGEAAVAVAACHSRGGVLIPMETMEFAERIAGQILQAAQRNSLPLQCRAVSGAQSPLMSPLPKSPGHSDTT